MRCIYCSHKSIKKGISKAGKQRYRCSHCKQYFQARYTKPLITQTQYGTGKLFAVGQRINRIVFNKKNTA